MSLVSVPFDSGMNEGIDTALLPQGVFREVRNMRLRRDGQLVPRPQLAAFSMNSSGSALTAVDLWRYRDQLIAAGYTPTLAALVGAWVYSARGGTTDDWRPLKPDDEFDISFPQVTELRDLPRPLPAAGGVSHASVAAGAGYVCTVWHERTTSKGYVLVQRASDGAQILYQQLPSGASDGYIHPKVVYVNTSFVIAAIDPDDDVRVCTFRPDSDTDLSASTQLVTTAGQARSFDIAAVRGSSNGFVIVSSSSTPALTLHGATVSAGGTVTSGGLFASTNLDAVLAYDDVALCADATDGVFVAARASATGLVTAWTRTIAGAAAFGPTTDIFDEIADGLTTGEHLVCCIAEIEAAGDDTHAIVMTSTMTDAGGSRLTRFAARSFAAHATPPGAPIDWLGSSMSGGLLATTFVVGGNYTTHVLAGGQLETFKVKLTYRPMQGSANALCQLSITDSDAQLVAAYVDQGLAGIPPVTDTLTDAGTLFAPFCSMAQDASTGKCYWVRLIADPLTMTLDNTSADNVQPVVSEFTFGGVARRQTAELDSQLFIAGSLPLLFAGGGLFSETSFEVPHITSITPSNGAGTLTNSGVYNWVCVFRWRDAQGRIHFSQPSAPAAVTLGAAEDTASILISIPHTRRFQPDIGSTIEIELYRTQNGGATFRLVERYQVATVDLEGENVVIVDTSPDTAIAANPILYTQSQTPVAHAPAPPCKYAVASRSRIVLGGTNDETEVVFSKLVFPGEPIEFAPPGLLGYRKSIGEPVTALMALDEQVLVSSAKSLYRIAGSGPDHSGQGEFLDPERIPGLGGVSDWRSVVEVPTGYFFQSSDEKLYFVDRSGAVSWVQGQAVRDTLSTYPTITAATYAREQNCVFFACRNSAGNDGVLLVFDLRRECWYVDSESTLAGTVTAAVDYQKRLTLASNGTVYQESPGTYLAAGGRVQTGNIRNGSLCSWNHLRRIGLRGSGLGTGTPSVTVSVDYDDGAGFVSLGAHSPSTTGNFIKLWRVGQQKVDSFKLRIDAVDVALNELVLDIEPRRGVSRRNPSDLK